MRFKIIAALLVFVALLLSTVVVLLLLRNDNGAFPKNAQENSNQIISGSFDVNGVIPEGATITLFERPAGSTATPKAFATGIAVADRSTWSFSNASTNKTYEITAEVISAGKSVAGSDAIMVTAPADDEVLTINITSDNPTGSAVISGNIVVNGYIPAGSTINIQGRRLGSQTFNTVARNLPGQSRQFMSYTTAVAGATYEVQGVLLNAVGATIGTSSIITITAPATNEELTINSSAVMPTVVPTKAPVNQPTSITPSTPTGNSTISGSINLNGAAPGNSRIVILQAPGNTSNYSVAVNNVSPTDGATWTWSSAQNATWYNLIAVLKQHNANGTDTDIATSSPITVAAPASNVVFTLNSGVSLSAPGGPISVNCQTYNGGPNQNNWNVVVTFQGVPGAQSYWYQIGTSTNSNNVVNTANQSNTVNATFNNSTTYYAQYAYANVPVASLGSPQWSAFSSPTPLQCSH